MPRLTDIVALGQAMDNLEDVLLDASGIIDAGFNLEVYGNPDGKASESSEGGSLFIYFDRETTYGELLKAVAHLGSIRDDSLSIRSVGADETEELALCHETPFSSLTRTTAA